MKYFDELDSNQRQLIVNHLQLVVEANEKVNLTRITSEEEAFVLHVEDSLSALPELNEAPDGLYGDLGSGAGYPGIPLAIASGRQTVLIDTRKKKMEMVETMIHRLDLQGTVRIEACRAELLARKNPECFSVITARAVAKLSVLMELASPLLMKHGILICYKSQIDEDERENSKKVQKKTGMYLKSERSFLLEEQYQRTIITFEKGSKPTISLPRKEGEAQKNPL